jgi:hypothetical protein
MARKKKEKEKTLKREQIRLLLHFQWLQGITAGDAIILNKHIISSHLFAIQSHFDNTKQQQKNFPMEIFPSRFPLPKN